MSTTTMSTTSAAVSTSTQPSVAPASVAFTQDASGPPATGCSDPGGVAYASRQGDTLSVGSIVNYTCDSNSTLTFNLTCESNLTWTGTPISCPVSTSVTGCGDPGQEAYADRLGDVFSFGSRVNYTCQNDNTLSYSLLCEPTGQWNGTQVACPAPMSTLWIASLAVIFSLAGILCIALLVTLFVDFGRYRHRKSRANKARLRKVESSKKGRPALFYVPISHKTQMMIYNDYAPKKVDILPYDEAKKHFPKATQLPPLTFTADDAAGKKKKKKKSKLLKGRQISDENMMENGVRRSSAEIRNNRVAPIDGSDLPLDSVTTDPPPYGAESWDTDVYHRSHQEASQMLSEPAPAELPKVKKKKKKKYRELDEQDGSGSFDLGDAAHLQPAHPGDAGMNDMARRDQSADNEFTYPV